MNRYLALLRGINVGGKNLIKMTALRACLEAAGFLDVATYIQSGNVVFRARESNRAALTLRIERALAASFGYTAPVVLKSRAQLAKIVARAPKRFGAAPARYRYDVLFLKQPLTAAVALKTVPARRGVDQLAAGPGVLYYSRLISRATQSHLAKLVALPIYQRVTIRNWKTTTALLRMLEGAPPPGGLPYAR
jgi:uncharacterized protein (DUF1697 family)